MNLDKELFGIVNWVLVENEEVASQSIVIAGIVGLASCWKLKWLDRSR